MTNKTTEQKWEAVRLFLLAKMKEAADAGCPSHAQWETPHGKWEAAWWGDDGVGYKMSLQLVSNPDHARAVYHTLYVGEDSVEYTLKFLHHTYIHTLHTLLGIEVADAVAVERERSAMLVEALETTIKTARTEDAHDDSGIWHRVKERCEKALADYNQTTP